MAFLGQNRSLRPPSTRVLRSALRAGVAVGLLPRFAKDRLVVWVNRRVEDADLGRHLLSRHLQEQVAGCPVHLGLPVRDPDPNYKPSLQLYSDDGVALGYAKIGWNQATAALVRNETTALQALAAAPPRVVSVPSVRYAADWCERAVLVAGQLPFGLVKYPAPGRAPSGKVLGDLAGPVRRRTRLVDSAYWRRTREEARAVAGSAGGHTVGAALLTLLDSVEGHSGHRVVEFARWHGDLVPWNVGVSRRGLHVWDWEHSAPEVPLGFELLHWHFQVAFVARGEALRGSLVGAQRTAALHWSGAAGSDVAGPLQETGRAVGQLYAAELALRTHRLMRGGGGWNPRIYPAVVDLLLEQSRDSPRSDLRLDDSAVG